MSSTNQTRTVVPAQLAFLTIYNPAFGDTDDTAYEQIFYYYSRRGSKKHQAQSGRDLGDEGDSRSKSWEAEKNERLRQVGLARGMVEFAK